MANSMRSNWPREEISQIYHQPFLDLLFHAQGVHRKFHPPNEVQLCRLLSIKTGGCPEDCAYCPQSAHYHTGIARTRLMQPDEVLSAARAAKAEGATRFCMGAAWRQVPDGDEFEQVLACIRTIAALDLEACCTLGMLTELQAHRLKQAGLTAYNHNLDTSPEFYGKIITTRAYPDRLNTIAAVRRAGITLCCGGIVGMGESDDDRIGLLHQLANLNPHPESVPINLLVRSKGTPLAAQPALDPLCIVRMIASARILMPRAMVRLAAGRVQMTRESILLCLIAGANSIFYGEQLLTTPNPQTSDDRALLKELGLRPLQRGRHLDP